MSTTEPRATNSGVRQAYKNDGVIAAAKCAFWLAYEVLFRRISAEEGAPTLRRVLSGLNLLALGVGSTLGVAVYVLPGDVAKNYAGPAAILSFLIAAVASMCAGLCYAELCTRVPKAGAAYDYSYVCAGEFPAFNIAWSQILVHIIGAASVAKALSEYLDSLLDKAISTNLVAIMPLDSPHLARYPDLIAFLLIMLFLSVVLVFGEKKLSMFNIFCIGIHLCVLVSVIISGCFKADTNNWSIPASDIPKVASKSFGSGGFAPYGVAGIIKGAAVCFYGFIGFDCVATAAEEARRSKTIAYVIVATLILAPLAYCGVSAVLTLMMPYFLADVEAPLPYIYEQLGGPWAKYAKHLVTVGVVCAFCSKLWGAMFALPRIIYAMCEDGLLYRCMQPVVLSHPMGSDSEHIQMSLVGRIVAGLFIGTLATIFEQEQLIQIMSIGTLLAYSMVASCVLLLRYEHTQSVLNAVEPLDLSVRAVLRQLVNADRLTTPTRLSAAIVNALVTLYGIWCFMMMSNVNHYGAALWSQPGALAVSVIGSLLVVATLFAISRQPVSEKKLAFSVPLVPRLPGLSILLNVYLMLTLDYMAWIYFAIWIAAGLIIYLTYGVWNSSQPRRRKDSLDPLLPPGDELSREPITSTDLPYGSAGPRN